MSLGPTILLFSILARFWLEEVDKYVVDASSDEGSWPFEGILEVRKGNRMLNFCKTLYLNASLLYSNDSYCYEGDWPFVFMSFCVIGSWKDSQCQWNIHVFLVFEALRLNLVSPNDHF